VKVTEPKVPFQYFQKTQARVPARRMNGLEKKFSHATKSTKGERGTNDAPRFVDDNKAALGIMMENLNRVGSNRWLMPDVIESSIKTF
jgi:hypothetical protein